MSETELLGEKIRTTSFEEIDSETVSFAKKMVQDTIGVSLAAVDETAVSIVSSEHTAHIDERDRSRYDQEKDLAHVLGGNHVGDVRDVAFVNGVMAHALLFDDTHYDMGGHPSAPILPAVLAIGEQENIPGRELLSAFVVGTEAEVVLGHIMNPGHYERGWHPTSVLGHLGATAAASRLLGLNVQETRHAIGIAASRTSGVKGNFGTMTTPLHCGKAARCGVESARLAKRGVTANDRILEETVGGFCDLFQGDPGYRFSSHLEEFGDPWKVTHPPVSFKPFPCGASTLAAVDAALELSSEHGFDSDTIETVEIIEHPQRIPHTDRPEPADGGEGRYSVQYCVAVALTDGEVWLEHFKDDREIDHRYRSVIDRTTLTGDKSIVDQPGGNSWSATVRVSTEDGQFESFTPHARGTPKNPMSDTEMESKYRRCAENAIPSPQISKSLELIDNLENESSIHELIGCLTGP